MIGPVEIGEAQRAVGYVGAGALAVKIFDVLIKWRARERLDALAELDAARRIGADIREELRRELEATRIELAECEKHSEETEEELRAMKRQQSTEARAFRHAQDEKP